MYESRDVLRKVAVRDTELLKFARARTCENNYICVCLIIIMIMTCTFADLGPATRYVTNLHTKLSL